MFSLYAADGLTATATGVIYTGLGALPADAGGWVHLDLTSVPLDAGHAREITFLVSVPGGATPGDHVGAIAAENVETAHEGQARSGDRSVGVALAVSTRLVTAVVVHVAGQASPGLALGPPAIRPENGSRQVVDLPMSVSGRLFVQPNLMATLRRCDGGGELARLDRQLDTMVPATSIDYQWSLGALVLPAGCYTVSVTADLGSGVSSHVRGDIWVTADDIVRPTEMRPAPPAPRSTQPRLVTVAVVGLTAALVVALALTLRRSRRRGRTLEVALAHLSAASSPGTS